MIQLVCDSKPQNDFDSSDSGFPVLSKPRRGFSFEPQVTVPSIRRVSRPKPIFLSLQSLYFGPNKAADLNDSKPVVPPKPDSLPLPRSRQRRKKKKTEWFYTSDLDPDLVFSQGERTQKRLRAERKWTKPSVTARTKNRRRRRRKQEQRSLKSHEQSQVPAAFQVSDHTSESVFSNADSCAAFV